MLEKAIPNLPLSGMDCCNVVQNELEDDKDRFCIVRLNHGDAGPKLGYTC